jgi:hypothetical protein
MHPYARDAQNAKPARKGSTPEVAPIEKIALARALPAQRGEKERQAKGLRLLGSLPNAGIEGRFHVNIRWQRLVLN